MATMNQLDPQAPPFHCKIASLPPPPLSAPVPAPVATLGLKRCPQPLPTPAVVTYNLKPWLQFPQVFHYLPAPPPPPFTTVAYYVKSHPPESGLPRPKLFSKRKWLWLPKGNQRSLRHEVSRKTLPLPLEFSENQKQAEVWTTVMIRNIPNKLNRDALLELLDKHCIEENKKAKAQGTHSPPSEYDFVYLPIDFRSGSNLGYAFVNLTTAEGATRLFRYMTNRRWITFHTRKLSHVCYARIQGKDALLRHFTISRFHCDTEDYLPVVFSPPRNGSSSVTSPAIVGKRVKSLQQYE